MNNEVPQFYQKNGWTVVRLARDFLNMEVGERIDSVAQYAERFQSGRGTIQYAMKFLLEHGCITLNKYGPKGTFISSLDHDCLWGYAGWGTLLIACPVPADQYIEAMLSGFYANLKAKKIPFNLVMMPNSGDRLRELNNERYHAVITTRLAMQVLENRFPSLTIVQDVQDALCHNPYVLMHHNDNFKGVQDGMTLALNTQSLEQWYLANALCEGKDVRLMEMSNQEAANAFGRGEADLIIARPYMRRRMQGEVHMETLAHLGVDIDSGTPVVAANTETYGIVRLLNKVVDAAQVCDVQAQVMAGRRRQVYF